MAVIWTAVQTNPVLESGEAAGTPALLTAQQLAAKLQTSKRSVFYWRAAGLIPSIVVGRNLVRFDLADVITHLKRRSPKGAGMR